MRVAIIKNMPDNNAGLLGQALQEAQAEIISFAPFAGGPLPAPGDFDALVVLGGAQNARDDANHPYLPALADLMHDMALAGQAVMGICLGAQILARGAGAQNLIGSPQHRHMTEFGWTRITPTAAAADDPLWKDLPPDYLGFQWHSDSFSAPPQAVHLATGPVAAQQCFRIGRAGYGCQFHFEASRAVVAGWCRDFPGHVEAMQPGFLTDHPALAASQGAKADADGMALARAWVALI